MPAPLTPFEDRGRVAPWTSRSEEDGWLDDLIDYVDTTPSANQITMSTVGESVDENPMRLLTIGTGTRTVLWVGQQHGSELAGREALFTTLREWADSTDPDLLAYLSEVTVLFMPTCHPDNVVTRENVNGVNLNRDHVQLSQPETQAIHAVLRDYDPDVVLDLHEGANIWSDVATARAYNVNAVPSIVALGQDLSDAVKTAVQGAGHTWSLYQGPSNMMRGAESLHNNSALQGRVSILVESKRVYGDDTDAQQRHDLHLLMIQAALDWHAARVTSVADAVAAARSAAAVSTADILLQEETDTTGPVVRGDILRYEVAAEDADALAVPHAAFALSRYAIDDGYAYPMDQPNRVLIAYLLDPESPNKLVDGTARHPSLPARPLITGRAKGYKMRIAGTTFDGVLRRGGP